MYLRQLNQDGLTIVCASHSEIVKNYSTRVIEIEKLQEGNLSVEMDK